MCVIVYHVDVNGPGIPVEDLEPKLTAEQKALLLSNIRSARAVLTKASHKSPTFRKAFEWVYSIRSFEIMLHDPHVPGNEIACRVSGLAEYLDRKHEEEETDQAMEEEDFDSGTYGN